MGGGPRSARRTIAANADGEFPYPSGRVVFPPAYAQLTTTRSIGDLPMFMIR
jgi:hypothetical protein